MGDDKDTTKGIEELKEAGDETAIYELGYHVLSSIAEEGLPAEVSNIKSVIEKKGGVFISEEFPVLTRLEYTMEHNIGGKRNKYDTAHFGWVKFELSPAEINNVKKELDDNENLLRFLIIHTVRENTRVPKHVLLANSEDSEKPANKPTIIKKPKKEEEKKEEVSMDEIDRKIEELVVE